MNYSARISRLLLILVCIGASKSRAADGTFGKISPLFDPARHMRVDEVQPGMKGYGLTVFQGTKIERFDVEVISILHNFNPKLDVVLIKCTGDKIEHTGAIAGMSGSPIFLRDAGGRDRMIGAFAYGWPMMKDVLAGVQPIQYMLGFPTAPDRAGSVEPGRADATPASADRPRGSIHWSIADLPEFRAMIGDASARSVLLGLNTLPQNESARTTQMQPLITPLTSSGLPSSLVEKFAPMFRVNGLALLQSGNGGAGDALAGEDQDKTAAKIEPGAALVAPLLTGDSELSAVGTCTDVVGDYVVAFGHPFNNEGRIRLPFASGSIQAVVAKIDQSFKLGSATKLRGTLINDQIFGVAGKLGAAPPTAPIDIHLIYSDGSEDLHYHFDAAIHPKLTPLVVSVAMAAAIGSARDLPQNHTLDYSMKLDFENGKSIDVNNVAVNSDPMTLFLELGLPMLAAAENPFERVMLKRVTGTVKVTPQANSAEILYVNVPKLKFRPGEMLKADVSYRPFRAPESVMPIAIDLPRDLPDGTYRLVVSDSTRYLSDQVLAEPFRFMAENSAEVFQVIQDLTSIRHDAVYARLIRQADGVASGRVAMPKLPSSRRQVLLGSGRSNATAFVSSSVKKFPAKFVMDGSADFEITIDSEAHIEVGGAGKAGKLEPANTPPPTVPNANEDKSKPTEKSESQKPAPPSSQPQ